MLKQCGEGGHRPARHPRLHAAGGKTGTNQSYRDAWYIGFTGHYVTGVWFGNDDFTEMNDDRRHASGGDLEEIMVEALASKPPADLPGVPVDDTHITYVAENQGTDGLPGATGGERARGERSARSVGESGDDNVNVFTPPEASDGVVSVLQDMFGFFGKKKQPQAAAARKRSARPRTSTSFRGRTDSRGNSRRR